MDNDNLVSVGEAAKIKGVSRQTIYKWMNIGRINTAQDEHGRKCVVVDNRFHESIAQGAGNKDYVHQQLDEMRIDISTLKDEITSIKEIIADRIGIDMRDDDNGCNHNVVAKSISGTYRGTCTLCNAVGGYYDTPGAAVNGFFQKHVYKANKVKY